MCILAGTDFIGQLPSTFNILPSDVTPFTRCVPLSILVDFDVEPDELIVLSLTQPASFASSAAVIIYDDDGKSAFDLSCSLLKIRVHLVPPFLRAQ